MSNREIECIFIKTERMKRRKRKKNKNIKENEKKRRINNLK